VIFFLLFLVCLPILTMTVDLCKNYQISWSFEEISFGKWKRLFFQILTKIKNRDWLSWNEIRSWTENQVDCR
jgi:hypothetical protein